MRDEEFAAGIDAIILSGISGHAAHRALDLWWTRYAVELGNDDPICIATKKWMAHIEGDHNSGRYPLGRKWWQIGPFRPRKSRIVSSWGEWTCP